LSVDFVIDSDRLLQIDDVYLLVLADTKDNILPGTRDISDEIPGRDGEFDFGTELEARILELHVAVPLAGFLIGKDFTHTKAYAKDVISKHFNPKSGIKSLSFADKPGKVYYVKYSGSIESYKEHVSWLEYTIPLKMPDPYIYSTAETVSTVSGATIMMNSGTVDAPVIVEVTGASTSPAITVSSTTYGSQEMQWLGELGAGETLVIDTDKMVVTVDGENAVSGYNNNFPLLPPGESTVNFSGGGSAQVKWRDKWV
jgi:phage-related protein